MMSILSYTVEDFDKWTTFRITFQERCLSVENSGVPGEIQNADVVDPDHSGW